jgi:3-isopropylmalate dehydratase small subunit
VNKDNLNTDGIYGKDYTYQDGMTPEQMAKVAMLNYDPKFQEIARLGDILVGGWNFGSGSSREQAATALKYRGIPLVIAGSYSQTYKRNAFNNGYIVISVEACASCAIATPAAPGRASGPTSGRVDFESSQITVEVGSIRSARWDVAQNWWCWVVSGPCWRTSSRKEIGGRSMATLTRVLASGRPSSSTRT